MKSCFRMRNADFEIPLKVINWFVNVNLSPCRHFFLNDIKPIISGLLKMAAAEVVFAVTVSLYVLENDRNRKRKRKMWVRPIFRETQRKKYGHFLSSSSLWTPSEFYHIVPASTSCSSVSTYTCVSASQSECHGRHVETPMRLSSSIMKYHGYILAMSVYNNRVHTGDITTYRHKEKVDFFLISLCSNVRQFTLEHNQKHGLNRNQE